MHLKNKRFDVAAACLMSCLIASPAVAQVQEAVLEIELACLARESMSKLVVTLKNAGDEDTAIVIGDARANGQRYLPYKLSVQARLRRRGGEYDLTYFNPVLDFSAGRIDPWIVPMPVDASYSIVVDAEYFWSPDLNMSLQDMADVSSIRVSVAAREIDFTNVDTTGLKLLDVFVGDIVSPVLDVPSGCEQHE